VNQALYQPSLMRLRRADVVHVFPHRTGPSCCRRPRRSSSLGPLASA
jgi:hypothetical protein